MRSSGIEDSGQRSTPSSSHLGAIGALLLVGIAGGSAVLVGDAIGDTVVVLVGLVSMVAASVGAGCWAFVEARRAGSSMGRVLWESIRTAVRAFFSLL